MSVEELVQLANESIDLYKKAGLPEEKAGITLQKFCTPKSERYRLLGGKPALYAEVRFFGDKQYPSVLSINAKDVLDWVEKNNLGAQNEPRR